ILGFERALRTDKRKHKGSGRSGASAKVVARAGQPFSATDERTRSADLDRLLSDRIPRYAGAAPCVIGQRRNRRASNRSFILPGPGRARAPVQTAAATAKG